MAFTFTQTTVWIKRFLQILAEELYRELFLQQREQKEKR
jgi:hypothetical protein